jgi:hypothetical protein
MVTYFVRRNTRNTSDLIRREGRDIFVNDQTVSSMHGTITEIADERYELRDKDSTNGTFVLERGKWVRIAAAELGAFDRIRIGAFETRICDLLPDQAPAASPRSRVRLERDPRSGAIVEKK